MMSRMHVHVKEQARLLSTPPTLDELHGQRLYIHPDVRTADVCDRCALLHLTPSEDLFEKPNIYCTSNTSRLAIALRCYVDRWLDNRQSSFIGLARDLSTLYCHTYSQTHLGIRGFPARGSRGMGVDAIFLGPREALVIDTEYRRLCCKKGMRSFTTNEMSEVCVIRDVCPSDCPKSKNLEITSSSQQYLSNLHPMLTK